MKLINRNDGIGYFWQWDTGQKISIVGSNVGDCALLSVGIGCTALRVDIREEDGARIVAVPDVMLQKAGDLHVYICECTAESMTTLHTQRFSVVARSKPADYVYTPEELKTWVALEERVDALERVDFVRFTETKTTGRFHSEEQTSRPFDLVFELDKTPSEVEFVPTVFVWCGVRVEGKRIEGNRVTVTLDITPIFTSDYCQAGGFLLYR